MVIVKMRSSLTLEWMKSYRFSSSLKANSISKTFSGNGVIVAGEMYNEGGTRILVMEVDSDGELSTSSPYIDEIETQHVA